MKNLTITMAMLLFSAIAFSQETATESDTLRKDALNVYMSASSYLKKEIPFINYVRDRKVADLVIIDTYQSTGGGGGEYTYYIEGQFQFKGMNDTLKFNTSPDDTQDSRREKEVKTLKMGLMRYMIKSPLAEYINIRFTKPISEKVTTDKWNSWVFRTRVSTSLNGQETYKSNSISGSMTASKVTSEWKINFSVSYSNSLSKYDYGDIVTTYRRKSSSSSLLMVKSINDHWSVGGNARVFNSIYSNYDIGVSIMPGIEYDIFPYSESTRRQFRILYTAGMSYNNYSDTTQFFKIEETLWSHNLSATFSVVQKWGSMDLSASWSNYFHNFSLNNLSLDAYLSLNIAKGLSFNLFGSYSFIHDQVSLRKGTASIEDVLLRRQELSTTYSYYASIGLTYTFGSIFNNTVNPRFTSSGGGGYMIMY